VLVAGRPSIVFVLFSSPLQPQQLALQSAHSDQTPSRGLDVVLIVVGVVVVFVVVVVVVVCVAGRISVVDIVPYNSVSDVVGV